MTAFSFGDPEMVRKPQARANDWTEAEIAQLRQLVNQGIALREVATRLGRSRKAVETKVNRMRLLPRSPEDWSDSEIVLLRKCAGENKSCAEAAEVIGRTPDAVRVKARKLGIGFAKLGESHHQAKLTKKQVAEIFALRSQGKSMYAVAKVYAVSQATIFRILNFQSHYVESLPLVLGRDCDAAPTSQLEPTP